MEYIVSLSYDSDVKPKVHRAFNARSGAEALGEAILNHQDDGVLMGFWIGDIEGNEYTNPDVDSEVLRFVKEGKKINAIKRYREITGLGLKEAKHAIEDMFY